MIWQSAQPTPEEEFVTRENVSLAWAAALQHLSPAQRAVLLLRDVLGLSAKETADALDTSVASVNSALQRARSEVGDGLEAPGPGAEAEDAAVERFIAAFENHDFDAVVASLAADVTWQMPPFDRWYRGARDGAELSWTHCPSDWAQRHGGPSDLKYLATRSNGQPAVGMYLLKGEEYEAFQFQVLRVNREGLVVDVCGFFDASLFRLAGLPLRLPLRERG